MGFRIRAAVSISVGAAVMGLAKLRQASLGAKDAVDQVGDATKKIKAFSAISDKLRSAAAHPIRNVFGLGDNKQSIFKRANSFLGGQTDDERSQIGDIVKQMAKPFVSPLGSRGPRSVEEARHEKNMYDLYLKNNRLLLQRANLIRKEGDIRRQTVGIALKGLNSVVMASREVRSWWKFLVGDMSRKSKPRGLRAISTGVKQITSQVKNARREFGSFASVVAGGLTAFGGARLLGGAGGMISRSVDLARAKEDARVTFDTMLGSADQSEILLDRITKFSAATPFQRSDLVEGSRQLLTITGKNIDKNEELLKLAANMAALKPGMRVADVSRALVSASVGEFDSLKTLGIVLSAEMFKGAGEKGGVAYSTAVTDAIRAKFMEKTGGRDLVGALSLTMSGLMSTVKDNFELILETLGTGVIGKLNIKRILVDVIPQINQFGRLLKFVLTGKGEFDFGSENAPPAFLIIASAIEDLVDRLIRLKDMVVNTVVGAFNAFNNLPAGLQSSIISIGSTVGVAVSAVGTIGPILLGVASLLMGMAGPIEAIVASIGSFIGPQGLALAAAFTAIGLGLMIFRREGESAKESAMRLWGVVKYGLTGAFENVSTVLSTMWPVLRDALIPAWEEIKLAFGEAKTALLPLVDALFATNYSMTDMENIGNLVGVMLRFLVTVAADALVSIPLLLIRLGTWIVTVLNPIFLATASDIKRMFMAFLEFINGTRSGVSTLGIIMAGFADVITSPFREAIAQLFQMAARAQSALADSIRPFSSTVASVIEASANKAQTTANVFREGFLATRDDLLTGGLDALLSIEQNATINLTQPIQLDGEKIAESQAQVNMRSRNSGRGGDPLSPEEMGFALTEGRIRTVTATEVLERASGR